MTTGAGAADGGPSSGTYGFPKSQPSAATYHGAGYPAKPPTLRAAVKSCDAEGVQRALVKLDSNAEAALDATDGVGRTLLHLSASQPLRPGTQQVVQLLLAHRARPQDIGSLAQKVMVAVDQQNAENLELWLSKLRSMADGEAAVKDLMRAFDVDGNTLLHRCAMGQGDDGKRVVEILVAVGSEVGQQTPSDDPMSEVVNLFTELGITADTSGGSGDLEALQAVETCNVEKMQDDLLEGSETERILSKGVDESGRQLLHLASCRGDQEAAADMVRLLLEHGAPVNAADFTGETPLSLAIAAALQTSASDRAWAALDTVRVLLVAGAIDLSASVLQRLDEANDEEAAELFRLLQAFGIGDFGAADAEMPEVPEGEAEKSSDLEQQCHQESIPLEQLGSLGARAVLAACEDWRQMTVKQLRFECSELGIPTEGCVEKAEVIQMLGGRGLGIQVGQD
eukprot:Skav230619  [mRNA]  locus=scaffold1673:71586:75111:+ [translate_table: standard]